MRSRCHSKKNAFISTGVASKLKTYHSVSSSSSCSSFSSRTQISSMRSLIARVLTVGSFASRTGYFKKRSVERLDGRLDLGPANGNAREVSRRCTREHLLEPPHRARLTPQSLALDRVVNTLENDNLSRKCGEVHLDAEKILGKTLANNEHDDTYKSRRVHNFQ